ncbi:hypothetical protein B0H16DRAFT_1579452, partial [Mycena metata]
CRSRMHHLLPTGILLVTLRGDACTNRLRNTQVDPELSSTPSRGYFSFSRVRQTRAPNLLKASSVQPSAVSD